jgi:hypothetical protein
MVTFSKAVGGVAESLDVSVRVAASGLLAELPARPEFLEMRRLMFEGSRHDELISESVTEGCKQLARFLEGIVIAGEVEKEFGVGGHPHERDHGTWTISRESEGAFVTIGP